MMNKASFSGFVKTKFSNNFFKKPRLALISNHFRGLEGNQQIEFDDADECLNYILDYLDINEEDSEQIMEDIVKVLNLSVSNRNPNIVMEFENDLPFMDLVKKLEAIFENEFRYKSTVFKLNDKLKCDQINKVIEVEFDFTEMALNPINSEEVRKSIGIIKLRFDVINKKVITSYAGNRKIHHELHDYLIRESLKIKPLFVLLRSSTIKNSNNSEFAPSTLLFMNLLFDVFSKMDLKVDLELLDFTNLEAVNIKGMTLKGTNLLNAPEIIQRIHNGDEIFKFKVHAFKILNKNGAETYFSTNFELSFEKRLCFVFDTNEPESSERYSIMGQIYDEIMTLLYYDGTVERGIELINEKLHKPKSTQMIVQEIYNQVSSVVKDIDERILIEKYFIDNFSYVSTTK
ncbi:hypothetical protein ACFVP8_07625 [Viridibacillus arvi]|uniref:hypothetical protein n=1 Tax=Viridibacillus arvi TaxID=263475 RepID=UPI0036CC520F